MCKKSSYWRKEVIATSNEETLNHVIAPTKERSGTDDNSVSPDECQNDECHSWSYFLSRKTL